MLAVLFPLIIIQADHVKAEDSRMKSDDFRKWNVHTQDIRQKIGLGVRGCPWSGANSLPVPASLPRCTDNVDVCFWKLRCDHPGIPLKVLTNDSWCHMTQSVQRLPCIRGKLPCLLANSIFYSFEKNICLSGASHLEIMGWDQDDCPPLDVISDHEARDLAGNAFSLPCSALVSAAYIANPFAPWHWPSDVGNRI